MDILRELVCVFIFHINWFMEAFVKFMGQEVWLLELARVNKTLTPVFHAFLTFFPINH